MARCNAQKFNDSFTAGIPDLFIAGYGWVELKMPGGVVKGSQVMWARRFHDRPLPVLLLFPGVSFPLAFVTPGKVTKRWFEDHLSLGTVGIWYEQAPFSAGGSTK